VLLTYSSLVLLEVLQCLNNNPKKGLYAQYLGNQVFGMPVAVICMQHTHWSCHLAASVYTGGLQGQDGPIAWSMRYELLIWWQRPIVITLWDVYFYANHTTSLSLLSEGECSILLFTHILADWFKQINGLFFSTADPGLIYVHGIDYEVWFNAFTLLYL
jgi:hypothetical protein